LTTIPKNPLDLSSPPPGGEERQDYAIPKSPLELNSLAELGAFLLAERERQEISRSDVSSRTKITMDQLANMEVGTFTGLAPVYAKGFLRSYAQVLGLDHTDIVAAYKKLTGQDDGDPKKPIITTKYKAIDLAGEDGISFTGGFLIFLGILLILTLLTIFNTPFHNFVSRFLPFVEATGAGSDSGTPPAQGSSQGSSQSQTQSQAQSSSSPASGQSAQASGQSAQGATQGASPSQTRGEPPSEESSQTQTQTPSQAPAPAGAAAPAGETLRAIAPEQGGRLTLTAVKATWVQAVVDNEKSIRHLIFKPGDTKSLDSTRSVSIITGDGSALEADWNGEPLGPVGPNRATEAHYPRPKV
jgi:cytoskeleton protein RodZ